MFHTVIFISSNFFSLLTIQIDSPRRVQVQLRCPSKDTVSLPRPFDYIPLHTGKFNLKAYNLLNSVDSAHNVFEDNKMEEEQEQPLSRENTNAAEEINPAIPATAEAAVAASNNFENVFDNEDAYKVLNEFLVNVASGQISVDSPSVGGGGGGQINSGGAAAGTGLEEDFYGSFEMAMKNPVIDSQDHVNLPTYPDSAFTPILPPEAVDFNQNQNLLLTTTTSTTEGPVDVNYNTQQDMSMSIQRNPNDPPPRPPKVKSPLEIRSESPPPPIPKRTKKSKDGFFKSLFSPSKSPKSPTKSASNNKKANSKPTSPTSQASSVSNINAPMDQDGNLECVEQFALYVDRGHVDVPRARIEEFYE